MQSLHTLTPHLVVRGAEQAARWYADAFGMAEHGHRLAAPGGKFMHIGLRLGDCELLIADEFPDWGILSPLAIGGTATVLELKFPDVRPIWDRALAHGAAVKQPLDEMFWGDLHGQLTDPFGHRWNLSQHLRDVPADEQQKAVSAMFVGA